MNGKYKQQNIKEYFNYENFIKEIAHTLNISDELILNSNNYFSLEQDKQRIQKNLKIIDEMKEILDKKINLINSKLYD